MKTGRPQSYNDSTMAELVISIPEALRAEFEAYCREQNQSASEAVRDLIQQRIATRSFREVQQQAVATYNPEGRLTEDELLREIS